MSTQDRHGHLTEDEVTGSVQAADLLASQAPFDEFGDAEATVMAPIPEELLAESGRPPSVRPAGLRQMFSRETSPASRPPSPVQAPQTAVESDALLDMLFDDARGDKPSTEEQPVAAPVDEPAGMQEPVETTIVSGSIQDEPGRPRNDPPAERDVFERPMARRDLLHLQDALCGVVRRDGCLS